MTDKPSISDLAGIDPDFTGGQCPEDFLDDLRSGGKVSELRAENKRLKRAIADHEGWMTGTEEARLRSHNNELRAKVTYLNSHLESALNSFKVAAQERDELYVGIESLRRELRESNAEIGRLRAEIEKLRYQPTQTQTGGPPW